MILELTRSQYECDPCRPCDPGHLNGHEIAANLSLYTYLAMILHHSAHISTREHPVYLLTYGAGGAVGNTIVSHLLDKGRHFARLLTAMICVLAVALFLLPIGATGPAGVVVLLSAWGFAAWSLRVSVQYQLTTVPQHAATAVAMLASAVCLGSAIGSARNRVLLTATTTLPVVAGAPGHTVTDFTDLKTFSGLSVKAYSGRFLMGENPRTIYQRTKKDASYEPKSDHPTTLTITKAMVPGATYAALLTDITNNSSTPRAYRELIVVAKSGVQYQVSVQEIRHHPFLPGNQTGLNYLKSFKLTS